MPERSNQIAEWIELEKRWREEVSKVLRHVDAKPQGGRPEGGTRAAARELNLSEADARRSVQVASLSEDAKSAAVETGLDDNRSALLEAAKAEPAKQAAIVRDIAAAKQAGRSKIDEDVKRDAAQQFAARLAERFRPEEWDWVKSSLYTSGMKVLADALIAEADLTALQMPRLLSDPVPRSIHRVTR